MLAELVLIFTQHRDRGAKLYTLDVPQMDHDGQFRTRAIPCGVYCPSDIVDQFTQALYEHDWEKRTV